MIRAGGMRWKEVQERFPREWVVLVAKKSYSENESDTQYTKVILNQMQYYTN